MPWRTDLLDPIPGDCPAGKDLRYDPVYDKIKEARREEDETPQGDWKTTRKVADWALVAKLAGDAIAKQSKDLQLAVWLTEAMVRREGISGLEGGLGCIHGLVETYWDTLYPELEDGDVELRAAPLDWLGLKLGSTVKSVPVNRAGHDWFRYKESRTVMSEADTGGDYYKQEERQKAIAAGKLTPEDCDKAVEETPKAFYKQLVGGIDASLVLVERLTEICDEKFGKAAPSFSALRSTLEEVRQVVHPVLQRKLELDPDPPEAGSAAEPLEAFGVGGGAAVAPALAPASGTLAVEPADRNDAVARIVAGAKFLRKTEPANPAAYLMLRGLRWGEVRAKGAVPDPKLLEAPATVLRTQLKSHLLDGKWADLLETSETAMAQPCGRGWLDIQRYAVTACHRLGGEYHAVGKAIATSLRTYLADVPKLLDMTMMDDTPVANDETREWLGQEVGADTGGLMAGPPDEETSFQTRTVDETLAAARSVDPEQAMQQVMHQLARERSARGRFRRKTQLAAVLLASGREAIALPILEDLAAQVDNLKLEEWESGEMVAESLALYYRCLQKLDGDSSLRQSLYLRLCRLDPLQALSCSDQA